MTTTEILNTVDNRALTAAVRSRINADARIISAKAAGWRLLGTGSMIAIAAVGIGLGIGAVCFGYAYVHDPRTSIDKMATAFATAMEKSQLKGEVTVTGGTVPLDTTNATVKLDSNSTVRVDGTVKLAPGSELPRALQNNLISDPSGKVVTNYTLFKYVPYERGRIVTGWTFANNAEAVPDRQYCYYSKSFDNDLLRTNIARDGVMVPGLKMQDGIDAKDAFSKCIWFAN